MSIQLPARHFASRPIVGASTRVLGLHRLLPMAYERRDMTGLIDGLIRRVTTDPNDAAAMVDMAMIVQTRFQSAEALDLLREAVRMQRDYCIVHGDGSGIRLLAFVTPGDFMANIPLDFLLNGSNAVLWLHYIDETTTSLGDLPDHDIAIMAIGEANHHGPVLARIEALLADYAGPVLNNDPVTIDGLTRDGVSAKLAGEPSLYAPPTGRLDRAALEAVAAGDGAPLDRLGFAFPLILRPIGTHAGHGMERVADAGDVARYLLVEGAAHFYVAPFVDYRGADGLFNKQRIVLIGGVPFASHMALSEHWMVHYLSAGMTESAGKRAVEADWMANFDTDFAVRHADAFAALNRHFGLDYFGIDCAELPDGRLLIFEVDVAMVVHDMDDEAVFPYKKIAMGKLFDAFVAMLGRASLPAPRVAA